MASSEAPAELSLDQQAEQLIQEATTPRRRVRPRLAEALYEAEDREVETPGGPVMAWRIGQGPAALLVHGWEDDNALWGPMIEKLRAYGRAVVALDLPGHGLSRAELAGFAGAGAAVKAVAEAFAPVEAVIGHSFGCVALTAALDQGMMAATTVLIASPLPASGRGRRLDRNSEAPPDVLARAKELLEQREEPVFDYLGAAARMKTRCLLIHSMDDDQCPPSNSERIAEAWPGARTLWVDGLGHRLLAQDEETTQRAADFIEGFEGG